MRVEVLLLSITALIGSGCALSASSIDLEDAVRVVPTNPSVSPDRVTPQHLIVDSERLTADWLARHHYQSGGGAFGDNQAIADFWYDGVHRRILTRSIQLGEVDDPVDIRLGRAEGIYPSQPNPDRSNLPDEIVGQIGGVMWYAGGNGFGAYTSSIRFRAAGAIELTRTDPVTEDPVPQAGVPLTGGFSIYSPGGNVPYDVVTRWYRWSGVETVARCQVTEIVLSGGGSCSAGALRSSMAVDGGWHVACTEPGAAHVVAVTCASR
jgi:hypothetical protein